MPGAKVCRALSLSRSIASRERELRPSAAAGPAPSRPSWSNSLSSKRQEGARRVEYEPDANDQCYKRHVNASTKGDALNTLASDPNAFELDRRTRDEIALFLAEAALAAGPAVMEEYERGGDARSKADGSPVTLADQRAEAIICGFLARIVPFTPVIAEESTAAGTPINAVERYLLVDPLDGTREFLARNGEFTINVALIAGASPDRRRSVCAGNRPVMGGRRPGLRM